MKIEANVSVQQAGVSPKTGEAYEAFASVQGTIVGVENKSVSFTVNGADAVSRMDKIRKKAKALRMSPVFEITGGTIAATPEVVSDGGIMRPKTWAGRPVHPLQGAFKYSLVGSVPLPSAQEDEGLEAAIDAVFGV